MKFIYTNLERLKMKKIKIKRIHKRDDCTLSVLMFKDFMCKVLELPDLDNQRNISCIPEGLYKAKKRMSPGKGYKVIEYIDVPNRTYIQLHYGNYTRQILGCQLPGEDFIDLDGDSIPDITNTKATLDELLSMLPSTFMIEVS
ncbi:MAG: hypothetical protein CMJ25_13495 [Phycisphaerae bacterium]|nr:hypothetical protein [Phycisphaerae bacterium]|tara:strand:+ start:132 stop:560 length:429 start_codon:yes stop_codon:yes gene_type:complete